MLGKTTNTRRIGVRKLGQTAFHTVQTHQANIWQQAFEMGSTFPFRAAYIENIDKRSSKMLRKLTVSFHGEWIDNSRDLRRILNGIRFLPVYHKLILIGILYSKLYGMPDQFLIHRQPPKNVAATFHS